MMQFDSLDLPVQKTKSMATFFGWHVYSIRQILPYFWVSPKYHKGSNLRMELSVFGIGAMVLTILLARF